MIKRLFPSFAKKSLLLIGIGFLSLFLVACTGVSQQAVLEGEVYYLNRMALPQNAVVRVSLVDVSLADAPAVVLANDTIPTEGKQVPIPFKLAYNPQQINPKHTYAVQARIEVGQELFFINTQHIGVRLDGTDPQPVRVLVDFIK